MFQKPKTRITLREKNEIQNPPTKMLHALLCISSPPPPHPPPPYIPHYRVKSFVPSKRGWGVRKRYALVLLHEML